MEFIKIENLIRGVSASDYTHRLNRNQKHYLELTFNESENKTFIIGWDLIVSQDGINELTIKTTDRYTIKKIEEDITEAQLTRLLNVTFEVTIQKYNDEKANYNLVQDVLTSPSLQFHQLLPELTRTLLTLRENANT